MLGAGGRGAEATVLLGGHVRIDKNIIPRGNRFYHRLCRIKQAERQQFAPVLATNYCSTLHEITPVLYMRLLQYFA